jgi:hypothetical protein
LAGIVLPHAQAQAATANPLITVDENGNGSFVFPGSPLFPFVGVVQADPGPGGGNTLTYDLLGPPPLVAGDVELTNGTFTSDLIRFNPAGTGSPTYPASVVFYSTDALGALADTALPSATYTNLVVLNEGANEITFYTPNDTQPGFIAGFAVEYEILSATPLPTALPLFATGIGGLGLLGWRRKRKARAVA